MDQFEKDLMQIFTCNPEWPICLFDFTFKNKVPNFFNFRIKKCLNKCIIDNYFTDESLNIWKNRPSLKNSGESTADELIIERHNHICTYSHSFISNFKHLFNTSHDLLFKSKFLNFHINDENEILEKIE